MVVAQTDASPFLTGMITTQGDRLVVANIPNGDPPMAFNVTAEKGFRAQNGKYIYFDYNNYVVRLDDQPHNETIYMEDGSVMTADMPAGVYPSVFLCPGPGNVFTLGFYSSCQFGSFVDIYPIPPQGLTQLWENHTQYPSPHQRGWLNWDVVNTTLGDNSTFDPSMITSEFGQGTVLRGAGEKVTVGWLAGLSILAVLF